MIVRKFCFSSDEAEYIKEKFDGYIWVAIDVKKGIIAVGDEHIAKLRLELLRQRSIKENIVGVGIDLDFGEVFLYTPINPEAPDKINHHRVPDQHRQRIDDLVNYFFAEFPCFAAQHAQPRFYKKPVAKIN